jgi:hypothetical protein
VSDLHALREQLAALGCPFDERISDDEVKWIMMRTPLKDWPLAWLWAKASGLVDVG